MPRTRVVSLCLLLLLIASTVCAADYSAVNETIWPSQNDIAQVAGNGKKVLENQWAKPIGALGINNLSLTGLTVPASDADLNIDVAAGTAYIAGRHITIPAATSVTAAASNTNYVFLKLSRDGSNLVTGAVFEVNTTGTPPADSTPICTLVASGTAITSTVDKRLIGPQGAIVLSSGTDWVVPAGLSRIFVEVFGASGGGGGAHGDVGGENGGNGGDGGTTTFDTLSVTGGAGGLGSLFAYTKRAGAAHGVGSGGTVNRTGGGNPGGARGQSANFGASPPGTARDGGDGGYVSEYRNVTQGTSLTIAIGVAGTAGASGDAAASDPGLVGRAGFIVVHY